MKKIKRFIPFILALIMALAIPLAGCDSCGSDGEKTLQSISIETDGAKTVFTVGDAFTSEGLVVKATYSNSDSETNEEVTLSSGDYEVDSTAYNKDTVGRYSIKVTYTYESVTKDGSYEVSVTPVRDGLEVTLAEGTTDTYTLSSSQTTVEIDTAKIVVKDINTDGTVGDVTSGYTTKLYRGQEEIALTGGKAIVGGGAYAIWVEKASDIFQGYTRSAFVLVYVNDDMVNFALKSGNFTQSMGEDVISETWVFTATYASGATKDVTAEECEYQIDTMNVAKDVAAVVSYTDYNAKGGATQKSVDISYTVTMVYGKTVYRYDYDAIDNSGMGGDQTDLKQSDLTGPNSFLKLGDGSVKYRNKTKWNAGADVIEIKECGFKVTFLGIGQITIGFSSTNGSNQSRVGLQDVSGNYVTAEYDETNANISKDTDGVCLVKGTSSSELTFIISKPGTYSIVCPAKDSAYNRACRIHSIEMEDNVDDPANIVCDVDFTDTAKFSTGSLVKPSDTAPVEIKDLSGASTGLSITKSHSALAANRIVDVSGTRVLQLQGAVKPEQNSLLFAVKAGKIKITVKYLSASGSYVDIINSDGTVLASSSEATAEGNVTEYTLTLDVAADMTLYLGSHSGQINITYLKVEKA